MPSASEYMDAAKTAAGIASDYELGKRLGLPRQHICDIRKGRRPIANYAAMRLAVMLDRDPAALIAEGGRRSGSGGD